MPRCTKIKHRTREAAEDHLQSLREHHKQHKAILRTMVVYKCPYCKDAWHVGRDRTAKHKRVPGYAGAKRGKHKRHDV